MGGENDYLSFVIIHEKRKLEPLLLTKKVMIITWFEILSLLILFCQHTYSYSFANVKSQSSLIKRGNVSRLVLFVDRNGFNHASKTLGVRKSMQMRDMSSANVFNIGDKVKVVSSVLKAGVELKGKVGVVQETWEKCDVDPTCCCAEFVDENFAVYVKFSNSRQVSVIDSLNETSPGRVVIAGLDDSFTHFFAEDELVKVSSDAS